MDNRRDNDRVENTSSQSQYNPIRTQKKGSFNFVDLLLILFVIGIIAFSIYAVISGGKPLTKVISSVLGRDSEEINISYTVRIENCSPEFAHAVSQGDSVYVGDFCVGTVSNAPVIEPYLVSEGDYTVDEAGNNTLVLKQPGDRITLVVTVESSAEYIEGRGASVNSVRIASGAEYDLRFPAFASKGKCVSVEFLNK